LDFLNKTVPHFTELLRSKAVLDYGSGWGWQSVAMYEAGASNVLGVDIVASNLAKARKLASDRACSDRVVFRDRLQPADMGAYDVAISCSSFEHFADPAAILEEMQSAVKPGGLVIISFAEPWYSPRGSHMNLFTKVPWVNLIWPEATVMKVRRRFRSDGAMRYEDVEGGLNRMTLDKFEGIIRQSGLKLRWLQYYSTKRLPLVDKLPILRELLVSAAACILSKE
jgi:SAM-dependent methyltransferase